MNGLSAVDIYKILINLGFITSAERQFTRS